MPIAIIDEILESVCEAPRLIAAAEDAAFLADVPPLPRCEWSERLWALAGPGPVILHSQRRHKRQGLMPFVVHSQRLVPIDMSRYSGAALRAIRARKVNARGEMQR